MREMSIGLLAMGVLFWACGGGGGGTKKDAGIGKDGSDVVVSELGDTYDPGKPPIPDAKPELGTDAYDPGAPDLVVVDTGPQPDAYDPGPPPNEGVVDKGPQPDTPPEPTFGSCKWFYMCIGDCPPLPQGEACVQQCQSQLTPEGNEVNQALQNCLQANGCNSAQTNEEFGKCLEEHCLDEYFTCFQGDTYQSCSDLLGCLNSCPKDDPQTTDVNEQQECAGNCWSDATKDAQWDLQHVIDCAGENCSNECQDPQSPACDACWGDVLSCDGACVSQWQKCAKYGDKYKTCPELSDCFGQCQAVPDNPNTPDVDENRQCQQDCWAGATQGASYDLECLIKCWDDACPICTTNPNDPQCNQCLNDSVKSGGQCEAQNDKCTKYGTDPCGKVNSCIQACQDQQCIQDCFGNGTKTAQQLYQDMIQCGIDACPSCQTTPPGQDCDQCLNNALSDETKCKDKFDACQNDNSPQ